MTGSINKNSTGTLTLSMFVLELYPPELVDVDTEVPPPELDTVVEEPEVGTGVWVGARVWVGAGVCVGAGEGGGGGASMTTKVALIRHTGML